MTVAMALAEFSHHSSRGQRMARAGVWGHEQNYTAKIRKPPTPQPELFSLEEEPGGGLPAPLSEVAGWQERVQRHVMEDLGSVCPFVQILDLPLPQIVGRLVQFPGSRAGFSKCPSSSLKTSPCVPRFLSRSWRNSWWKCRRFFPIPCFSGLWSSSSTFQFLVGGPSSGLQGFSSGQRSTASPSKKRISERIVEQIVDPVSGGRLQGSSSSHSPAGVEERADEPGKGVFRTFPKNKKSAKVASHSGSELLAESSPSTRAAQLEDSVEWVRLRDDNSGEPYYWQPPPGVKVVWIGERNVEGLVWYWHRDTRVSVFDLPPLHPG